MTRAKKSRSPTSSSSVLVKQSTTLPQSGKRSSESVHTNDNLETIEKPLRNEIEFENMQTEKDDWKTVSSQRSNKIQKTNAKDSVTTCPMTEQLNQANKAPTGIHTYFTFGENQTRTKPKSTSAMKNFSAQNRKNNFPPFKIEFENQQKPIEIHVLNELVKNNNKLNVSSASYSSYPQSRHVLLLFANDSSSYELLFENNTWPKSICGLSFRVIYPNRIPTSYSIIVNQIPRDWIVDSILPLIASRYPSVVQVVRIFRDDKPTNRIRIDFRSNDDVQTILQVSYIYIDSIRYPAVAYKPLIRIERCFRCQQFGHKSTNCSNEPKCYKCGESHEYQKMCLNGVKCANCSGQHMAGAPECPVKISYRKDQQQNNIRKASESSKLPYLSSPAKLYSTVLQTTAPLYHTNNIKSRPLQQHESKNVDQSSLIIESIKEEINRSQTILMERIMQLELKCEAVQDQQKTLTNAIDTLILPSMTKISDLFINVCQQLVANKVIDLSEQQLQILSHLCPSMNATSTPSMPSFSNLPPVFTFVSSTPPLVDTFPSNHQHSPSLFQSLSRPNTNSFFSNSNHSTQ